MDDQAKKAKVYRIFESVAETYDAANDRISLGLQKSWKRMLTQSVMKKAAHARPLRFLDLCCGTGDIAIMLAKDAPHAEVTGVDFSPAMLAVAKEKSRKLDNLTWSCADVLELPFEDNRFQATTISFGLRNTTDYEKVLAEMIRVTAPGGSVYVLDSCIVDSKAIKPFYTLYFRYIVPIIGGGRKHHSKYRWLWQSTDAFLRKDALTDLFIRSGLTGVRSRSRMFGACVLIEGQKTGNQTGS